MDVARMDAPLCGSWESNIYRQYSDRSHLTQSIIINFSSIIFHQVDILLWHQTDGKAGLVRLNRDRNKILKW